MSGNYGTDEPGFDRCPAFPTFSVHRVCGSMVPPAAPDGYSYIEAHKSTCTAEVTS